MTPVGFIYLPLYRARQRQIYFFGGVAVAGVGDVWCLKQQASAHRFMVNLASWSDDFAYRHMAGNGVWNFAKAGAAP